MAYGFSGLQGSLEEEIERQLQQRDRDGLTNRWPHAEEDMRLFAAAFTGAAVLARQDGTVRDILRAEAAPFFAGERSAEGGLRRPDPGAGEDLPLRAVPIKKWGPDKSA